MDKHKRKLLVIITLVLCIGILIFPSVQVYLSAEEDQEKDNSGNNDTKSDVVSGPADSSDIKPYRVRLVDRDTRRGVPMVELKTTNGACYYTDSNGYIYFYDPGLMGEEVWFTITSHGYRYPKESMAGVGEVINIRPDILEAFDREKVLSINRENIAERLYRVTGQGIYSDSKALNIDTPIDKPVLNAKVMKHGPAKTIVYEDKIYWFWENTIGTFSKKPNLISGAVSKLPKDGGLDPSVGVNLEYFTGEDGFARELLAEKPKGTSKLSINGLLTISDKNGEIKLLAGYASYSESGNLTGRGILIFDDKKEEFRILKEFDVNNKWQFPRGNAVLYEDNGKEYWLFCDPYANVRVLNDFDSVTDQSKYEAFTPIKSGTEYRGADTSLDFDSNNKLEWTWKSDAPPLTQLDELNLIRLNKIDSSNAYHQLKSDQGDAIELISASIEWNEYRKKWVMLGQQQTAGRASGNIWYSEADTPVGPWKNAKQIVSHVDYAFNNPIQHPYFSQEDGRLLYFEGNLTNNGYKTKAIAQYNDNQIMYRLDLDDKRLGLIAAP